MFTIKHWAVTPLVIRKNLSGPRAEPINQLSGESLQFLGFLLDMVVNPDTAVYTVDTRTVQADEICVVQDRREINGTQTD